MTADIQMFINRLRKNARHWDKWARRQGLECYRLYDRDIPEFPLALDRYAGRVHLQEYQTAWEADEAEQAQWRAGVLAAVSEVLDLPRQAIACKQRQRQKGAGQYAKTARDGEDLVVTEQGLRFIVNLDRYLDTGLFLDHRNTRRLVRELATGRRFLNLFAYTGSFTVYAAAGGALSSTTVDMSRTYQDWSRRNFVQNGMDLARHRLECADVFSFLSRAATAGQRYDLIVMDPPSFSNSKKMQGVLDVQRDHVRLIEGAMALLETGGELIFSTNLRGFRLDESALASWRTSEISRQSVPEDFRNRRIHRCWRIARL